MPEPKTKKEVCGFLGRLNYIARFISNLTATCEPMFKLLRKYQVVWWNESCRGAFERIKEYLQEPPIIITTVEGRPLIMYLTVLDESCILMHIISYMVIRSTYLILLVYFKQEIRRTGIQVNSEEMSLISWFTQATRVPYAPRGINMFIVSSDHGDWQ